MPDLNLTLVQLWELHGRSRYYTDKGDGHSFLPTYDLLFAPFKKLPVNIFEIGHSAGGALRLFDDYFTHSDTRIVGIDQSDNDWITMYDRKAYETKRVKTYLQDVHKLSISWFNRINFLPDIIIEDSNHQLSTQLFVVQHILPLVRPGGILIIEDVLYPQERRKEFEKLGIPFELIDLNPIKDTADNALIIYRK